MTRHYQLSLRSFRAKNGDASYIDFESALAADAEQPIDAGVRRKVAVIDALLDKADLSREDTDALHDAARRLASIIQNETDRRVPVLSLRARKLVASFTLQAAPT